MRPLSLVASLFLCLFLAACGPGGGTPADGGGDGTAQASEGGSDDGAAGGGSAVASSDALPNVELLKKPYDAGMNAEAPAVFKAKFATTKGDFVVEVHREWSPRGADRFYNLVKAGFFDDVVFFRAVRGFMVQFGIHGDPDISRFWRSASIKDDPVIKSNRRSYLSFAMAGPHTRSTQFFINTVDNTGLDKQGFSPFGQVIEGMDVVDSLHTGYGEQPSRYQGDIQRKGNAFLDERYPDLDRIKTARLVD